jgi:hypothetical protein
MSWSLFKTKCMVLTGQQHISVPQFAQTISDAYHQAVSLHFDTMTAGGTIINNAPKFPILNQQILAQCNANLASQSEVHILNQIGPFILSYWTGLVITGPTGVVTVLSPGTWVGVPVVQNLDFNIMLNMMVTCFRTHIMTVTGQYVSSVVPGVVSPWSGALLQALP